MQLRRGDLAFTPPPWHQTYDATAEQLHTPEMIKVLDSQVWSELSMLPDALALNILSGVSECKMDIGLCRRATTAKSMYQLISLQLGQVTL